MKLLHRLAASEAGATLVEYSLLTSLIAIVVILVVTNFGAQLVSMYGSIDKALFGA